MNQLDEAVSVAELPSLDEAIRVFEKSADEGTPLDPETWISSYPETIRPLLRKYLNGRQRLARFFRKPVEVSQDRLPDFGKYRDIRFLARGGMGAVYTCTDTVLGRTAVLKVLHHELSSNPEMVKRFEEEARIAARMQHSGVAPVHDFGRITDGRPYIAMKLVQGQTFARAIATTHQRSGEKELDALLRQFIAICETIAYAHREGVLHRDLKPANIMLGEFGEVLVMDWGLSKGRGKEANFESQSIPGIVTPDATEAGKVRGSFAYMPPEQADPDRPPLDTRCDIFALGAILCEILTGLPPYVSTLSEPSARRMELWGIAREGRTGDAFRRLEDSKSPQPLVELAKACLAAKPDDRPPTAREVGDRVASYFVDAQEQAKRAEIERAQAFADRKRRRWRSVAAFATLVFLFALSAAGIWYKFDRDAKRAAEAARAKEEQRLNEERVSDVKSAVSEMYAALKVDQPAKATAALANARGRLGSDAPTELVAIVNEAGENHALYLALERIRMEKGILTIDGTPLFHDTAIAYAKFFEGRGFHISDSDLPRQLTTSPIRNSLIAAFDDWATHEKDPVKQDQLFAILHQADPDSAWANRLRDRTTRRDREQLKTLLAEAPWETLNSPFLFAILEAFQGDPELAGPLLQKAAIRFANDFWFNMATGVVLVMQAAKHPKEEIALRKKALGYFRTAAALRPESDLTLAVFAMYMIDDGDHQEAKLLIDRLEERSIESWSKYMVLGRLAQKQGRQRAAVEHYKKACALSEHIAPQVELAQAHLFVGDLKESAKIVDAILEKNPDHPNVLPLKAVILATQLKLQEAWLVTQRVLEANPQSMGGRVALFVCLIQRGRLLDAQRVLASFTGEERKNDSLAQVEFLFEIFRGELDNALKLMTSFPAETPMYTIDCYRIIVLANLGRLAEAKKLADKTLKAVSDNRVDLAALTGGEFSTNSLQFLWGFLGGVVGNEAALETGPSPNLEILQTKKVLPIQLVALADLLLAKRRYHDALRIYDHALPARSDIGGARQIFTLMPGTSRFKALRAAAQSLAGTGPKGKPLGDVENTRVRALALRWFDEEVAALRKTIESINTTDPFALDKKAKEANLDLHYLRMHRDLAPIRDADHLKAMPEEDRKRFEALWTDVDSLLLKLNPPIEWLKLPKA